MTPLGSELRRGNHRQRPLFPINMQSILPVSDDKACMDFSFPKDCHLLITTPGSIYAWDHASVNVIFRSSKKRIVAAREAPNGSGVIAVADRHIVVLHDTKRGQEKSWGLGAEEDEVRQLEYTTDARSLYFSTSLTPDIQRYSLEVSKLLEPLRAHASPPVALAISPTARFMVSASDNPPVVYLRNLENDTSPILIEPRASTGPVAVATFHRERPNIFLLAFRDGTAAAYDVTKMLRHGTGLVSNQESLYNGEICHLTSLHRAASNGSRRVAISDAAFLPGFKLRAVTVGYDGRCRIIDFADGSVIIRTWNAHGPVTSVSVIPRKADADSRRQGAKWTPSHVLGGPTSTDSFIAIGKTNGELRIYNSVGLLLGQCAVGESNERIISARWMKGDSPRPFRSTGMNVMHAHPPPRTSGGENQTSSVAANVVLGATGQSPIDRTLTEHATAKFSNGQGEAQSILPRGAAPYEPLRRFTIHSDEGDADIATVRRTPLIDADNKQRMPVGDLHDLFSSRSASQKHVASPPRSRPTVTSQTFVKSPEPGLPTLYDLMVRRRNLALFPSTDSKPEITAPLQLADDRAVSRTGKPVERAKFRANSAITGCGHAALILSSVQRNEYDRLSSSRQTIAPAFMQRALHGELPKLNSVAVNSSKRTRSVTPRKGGRRRLFHRPRDHLETDANSDTAREAYDHSHKRCNWPEDSCQESLNESNSGISPDLRKTDPQVQHVQKKVMEGQIETRTPHSRMHLGGTTSKSLSQGGHAPTRWLQPVPRIDGSTEGNLIATASTRVTFSGIFLPSSRDVCALFPRSSSLSPQKRRRSKPKAKGSLGNAGGRLHLNIMPESMLESRSESAWPKAKVLREIENCTARPNNVAHRDTRRRSRDDFVKTTERSTGHEEEAHCVDCRSTHAKVSLLQAEVTCLGGRISKIEAKLKRLSRQRVLD